MNPNAEPKPVIRKDRYARKPEPEYYKGNAIERKLNDIDIERMAFMARHGGSLPTSYIHACTADKRINFEMTSRRLLQLLNMGYIHRKRGQVRTVLPYSNELTHSLTPEAVKELTKRGLWSRYFPPMNGWYEHQTMSNCLSASIELNARNIPGVVYVPQHELCERVGHSISVKDANGKLRFTPDFVCALFFTELNKHLYIFGEADRANEDNESADDDKATLSKKVVNYHGFISHHEYIEFFNGKEKEGAVVLIVTTERGKAKNILKLVDKEFGRPCSYILVTAMPEFGWAFRPPRSIDVLGTYFQRNGEQPASKIY